MPDGFLLKSVVFKLISKENSRAEHEYMNIPPPPPINALATALHGARLLLRALNGLQFFFRSNYNYFLTNCIPTEVFNS